MVLIFYGIVRRKWHKWHNWHGGEWEYCDKRQVFDLFRRAVH